MLFTRYNLFKNHGDFVHLNMLKWALKYVPELGKKTVPDDETVKSMEIGTGGVDISTVKDATGEVKSKHVPYTDVQVNGASKPTFKLHIHNNGEADWATVGLDNAAAGDGDWIGFDRYTKVIDSDGIGKSDPGEQYTALYKGMTFYDKDTIKVDGIGHKYVTKIKYLLKDDNGTLTDANQDKEFKPYTSVIRDDNSLASQMKIKHDSDNHLTGVSFPATGEDYNVDLTHISVNNIRDDDVNPPVSKEYKKYLLELDPVVDTSDGARKQRLIGILIGDVYDGLHIDLSGLNIMAERTKGVIPS